MSLSYNNFENEELLNQSFESLFPDLFSTVSSQLPPTPESMSTEEPVIMQRHNSASEIDLHQSVEKSETFNKTEREQRSQTINFFTWSKYIRRINTCIVKNALISPNH